MEIKSFHIFPGFPLFSKSQKCSILVNSFIHADFNSDASSVAVIKNMKALFVDRQMFNYLRIINGIMP